MFGENTLAIVEVMSGPMDGMKVKINKQIVSIGRLEKYRLCLNCEHRFADGSECPKCRSSRTKFEENDIALPLDRFTSRIHAKIAFEGEKVWLQDLGSANGTWLVRGESEERISGRESLGDGDIFLVGHTYLRLKMGNLT
jgi:pSer/pThr/pTyr-binding forkhead associated (FHA) protein